MRVHTSRAPHRAGDLNPQSTVMVMDHLPEDAFIVRELRQAGCRTTSMFDVPDAGIRAVAFRLRRRLGILDVARQLRIDPVLLNQAETFIVPDTSIGVLEGAWIRERRPEARVILWLWNPVSDDLPSRAKAQGLEVWTFDEGDARAKGLRHNTQYYFKSQQPDPGPKLYDVSFIGRDKGRADYIAELDRHLSDQGFVTNFQVVPKKIARFGPKRQPQTWVPYRRVIEASARSRAVLDIVQAGQTGLTLRAMEALFLNVKLITNNSALLDQDNYPTDNVFLLNESGFDGLSDFLEDPVQVMDEKARDYYSFERWLGRFAVAG